MRYCVVPCALPCYGSCDVIDTGRGMKRAEDVKSRSLPTMRGTFMVTRTATEAARQVVTLRDLTRRVQAEYTEMPGLSVTLTQAQRLLGIDRETCVIVIRTLVDRRFLRRTPQGRYVRF